MNENEETNEVKLSTEDSNTQNENSSPSEEQNNIIINVPKKNENEENSETISIKQKIPKSEFENHIINAYKKLTGLDSSLNENNKDNNNVTNEEVENQKEKEPLTKSESKINIKRCENEIRLALKTCI